VLSLDGEVQLGNPFSAAVLSRFMATVGNQMSQSWSRCSTCSPRQNLYSGLCVYFLKLDFNLETPCGHEK
jgi:hypothetical protein